MKVPGKKFVGTLGFALTMLSAMMVVGVMSGVPFAASAAAVDGFHTEIDHVRGSNFSLHATMGGVDECQSLLLNEIDEAHVSGFALYRKVEFPGGNISLEMKIPEDANVSMQDVEMKMMGLQSEWLNATDTRIDENYSPTMTMGRQKEFNVDIGGVAMTNATARMYAFSSGSMQMPVAMPEFDLDVNEPSPDGMPMTRCPDYIENGNASRAPKAPTGGTSGTTMSIAQGEIGGRVTDESGNPISGASVRIPHPEGDMTDTTDDQGQFVIDTADREVTTSVTVIVERSGYTSGSTIGSTGETVSTTLHPANDSRVTITSELHHLGDGQFDGPVNANFQEPVESDELSVEFTLSRTQARSDAAELRYSIRGAQLDNEVGINGRLIADADSAPADGSASERRLDVNPVLLEEGTNRLQVEATSEDGNLDDFEITNVRLVFDDQ
jgi:hypothetical protein